MQALSGKLGLPDPKMTLAQHKHGSSRRVVALARQAVKVAHDRTLVAVPLRVHSAKSPLISSLLPHHAHDSIVGISIGCILGMVPLLFVDTFKKVWKTTQCGVDTVLCLVLFLTSFTKSVGVASAFRRARQ
jgi:hypothetical protein